MQSLIENVFTTYMATKITYNAQLCITYANFLTIIKNYR